MSWTTDPVPEFDGPGCRYGLPLLLCQYGNCGLRSCRGYQPKTKYDATKPSEGIRIMGDCPKTEIKGLMCCPLSSNMTTGIALRTVETSLYLCA